MKRLFQLGKTGISFKACLCATIFCLLCALTALVVAKTPPRHLSATGATRTARTSNAGSTGSEDTQVTTVPPFVGTHSETWEEFGVSLLPDGTSILGGIATITGSGGTRTEKTFRMCTVFARPHDGSILMDSDRPTGPVTISFSQPVSSFGAYWGSGHLCNTCCGFADAPSILTFQDVNGNVIGSDSFYYTGNGTLTWHGYTFGTPVKTITRTAGDDQEGFAVDGLQATVASSSGNSALLANISTRAFVQTGDNVLIGGFIITGNEAKKVIIRGIGPSLANAAVAVALADPTLELHQGSTTLATNDNWKVRPDGASQQVEIEATTIPPTNDLESALVATLDPGTYTAILRGKNNGTGVGLIEVYDLAQSANSKLANISTRGFVDTGDNVMIGGFIVGNGYAKVIVRAIGPSLTNAGIQGALQDPMLELHNGNGTTILSNDNWKDSQQVDIQATGIAPSDDRESAIVATLTSGNYTAVVRGSNNATGIGLVEVYNLP